MIKNKRCYDCGRIMPMYHNADRCYKCAMRHRKEYDHRRKKLLRAMKKPL